MSRPNLGIPYKARRRPAASNATASDPPTHRRYAGTLWLASWLCAVAAAGLPLFAGAQAKKIVPMISACGPKPIPPPCVSGYVCDSSGSWVETYSPAGTACSINACTYGSTCDGAGTCSGGTTISCVSDQCFTRTCNGMSSCSVTPKAGAACDDGNACTYNDVCSATGVCGGTTITCASDFCASRSCNGTASCTVVYASQGTACGGSSAPCAYSCNGGGSCIAGTAASRGTACPYLASCAQICDGISGACQPAE